MDPLAQKLQDAIAKDDIAGAVAAARNTSGSFAYTKAFGQRTRLDGSKKPLEPSDVLALYSATKIVTAIAVMQCVEKGLFSLDEDISRVLTHFKTAKVLTGFDGETPQFEEPKTPVTLKHLLTHASGTPYDQLDPQMAKWREQNGGMAAMGAPTVETRYNSPLAFQPGTKFGYGSGLDWAGHAVELVSSCTLESYFQQHIFTPLGVERASFFPMKDTALKEIMVDLNPDDPNGLGLAPMGGLPSQAGVNACFGGQGLWLPGAEYIKILHSLLANDGKLLQPTSVDRMFEPHLEPEAHTFVNTTLADEMANSPLGAGLPKGIERDYGLSGLLVQKSMPGWYSDGTLTWGGALNSTWFIDRKAGLCGFGSVQMHLRDGPFTRGPDYEFKPHRDGAMRWEEASAHFKQVCREGIYAVYKNWQEQR